MKKVCVFFVSTHPQPTTQTQVVNRDLSCAVLRVLASRRAREIAAGELRLGRGKGKRVKAAAATAATPTPDHPTTASLTVLEGLAATGLRAIRYATEVDAVARVVANDADEAAVASIRAAAAANGPLASAKVHPRLGDCRTACLESPDGYDVVDLDPYGSPAHLLDAAMVAVSHGGLLAVTATDMAVLCGANPASAYAKYGAMPLHRAYGHEQGLRIVLGALEAAAARCNKAITPVLSLSIDFYVRVFVRVHVSPASAKLAATRMAHVWQSSGCDSFVLQPVGRVLTNRGGGPGGRLAPAQGPPVPDRCPDTGSRWTIGGPMWVGALHDAGWVEELRAEVAAHSEDGRYPAAPRVAAVLAAAAEELPEAPLYYNVHDLCKAVRCTPPRVELLRSALVNAGYRVSGTHANPLGLKTNAPPSAIWDVMRCWVAAHPPPRPAEAGSTAAALLAKQPELKADFSRAPGAASAARGAKVARFLPNPEPFWGPKARAGTGKKAARQAAMNAATRAAMDAVKSGK